ICTASEGTAYAMSESSVRWEERFDAFIEWFELLASPAIQTTPNLASHIVIALVVQHVAHKQNDGLVAQVLPPVGGATRLRPYLTSFVHNRNRAVAGIFDDLAFCDVDDRRTIAVTVPRHDAAWLDSEFAEPELTPLDVGRLLFKIDGGEDCVGDALGCIGDRRTYVGFHLVGGATASSRGRNADERRSSGDASKNQVLTERSATRDAIKHVRSLLCKAFPEGGRNDIEN